MVEHTDDSTGFSLVAFPLPAESIGRVVAAHGPCAWHSDRTPMAEKDVPFRRDSLSPKTWVGDVDMHPKQKVEVVFGSRPYQPG